MAAAPDYLPGYYEIVFNLQAQGRPRDALIFAQKAVDIDPLGAMSRMAQEHTKLTQSRS